MGEEQYYHLLEPIPGSLWRVSTHDKMFFSFSEGDIIMIVKSSGWVSPNSKLERMIHDPENELQIEYLYKGQVVQHKIHRYYWTKHFTRIR